MSPQFESLTGEQTTDVLIIGAGITGLSAAIELANRGYKVIVCEAEVIGAGTTAASTGHLDAHPESGPKALIKQLGLEDAKTYTSLRLSAIDIIEQRSNDECNFVRLPAYQYSESASDADDLAEQLDAAQKLGLNASACDSVPIARATCGFKIDSMGRLDCAAYLKRLTEMAIELGVNIFERTLVEVPVDKHPTSLKAGSGSVKFKQVICATHCNNTKANLLYAATPPYQSYVVAARIKGSLDDALYWDNSDPYYYVRRVHSDDGSLILVGGCDHRTGAGNETAAMQNLRDWTFERFDVESIEQSWSAEFFMPTDGLPMIGLGPGKENIWVATGFNGVGLTLGTAAAKMIADGIDGKQMTLEKVLSPSRLGLSADWVGQQATTAANFAERILPAKSIDPSQFKNGEGDVGKIDGKFMAGCRDKDGCEHRVSAICPHMGGVMKWNEVEQTWDCPVHGGRFTADGTRMYGPPETNLEPVV